MSLQNKYIDSSTFATATAVYEDVNLITKSPDGYYQDNGIYRRQLNGILGPNVTCEECVFPCGGGINPPNGDQGLYQLDFDAGQTASDVGAISIHFNPASVPDGIRVLYDGVYYNRLSSPTDGNRQSTSGVADSFTILGDPTDNCVPSAPDTRNYIFYQGFTGANWNVGTPSPQSVTIQTGDNIRGGEDEFNLLIVPKPLATPGIVSIQVLGPCATTGWSLDVDCPAALPSFTGEAIGSGIACQASTTTFYFGRFRSASNAYPILNNPVFLDHDGVNRATDQNYIMDNNNVITVTNGVVSNIRACDPT